MKKHDINFIIGLTIIAAVVWIAGELIMGIWIAVYNWVLIVWRILIIVGTLAVSVWHSFKYDENFNNSNNKNKKK